MRPRNWLIVGLLGVAAMAATALLLAARSPGDPPNTTTVTVPQLWAHPDGYLGRRVATSGVVRVFDAGQGDEYDVLEGPGQYRVGLRGVPPARLRPCVGRQVWVEGVPRFAPGYGLALENAGVTPAAGVGCRSG